MTPPESTNPPAPTPARDPVVPHRSRLWATVRALLRARVTAGLILVLPIWITWLLVKFVFDLMRDASLWVVDWYLRGWGASLAANWQVPGSNIKTQGIEALDARVQWGVAIFSVFLTVFSLYVVGLMTTNIFGKRLVRTLESLVDRLPFVKTIYRAIKQILETFTGDTAQSFQRVALIPFPTKETLSIGFITGMTRDARNGDELCTVFVATTPNPTTGYVFVLKRADVIELDWSVEEAIRVVISGGVLAPPMIPFSKPAMTTATEAPVPSRAGTGAATGPVPGAVPARNA